MKKIIIVLILSCSLTLHSQQATDSIHRVSFFKKPYNGANGASSWLAIGVLSIVVGGSCQFVSANPKMPFPKLFGNNHFFKKESVSSEKTQNILHTVFGFGVGIAGFSTIMAHYDFGWYLANLNNTKHTILNFKVSPGSVGFCLKFK